MTASVDIAAKNEKTLRQIAVAVSRSQGQFKLMRLRCDYQQEQRQWAERLQSLCRTDYSLTLPVLDLKPDDTKLFSQIQDFITAQATPPGGIQVMGFEALSDRPNALKSLNLIRENLNQLALPVLWWLDEGSLIDLMHYANDIHSWSTSKQFLTSDRVLEQIITSYTDRLQHDLDEGTSDQWVGERAIWSASDRFELQMLEREVQAGEANCFTPEVQANFHFVVGRSAYEAGHWQQAKNHWQSSLEFNPDPWLLFHLGLAVLKLGEQDHALRAEAETLLDRSCEALPQLDKCEAIVLLRGWQRSFPAVDVRDLSPENLEQAITALDSIAEFDRVGFPQLHCQALKRLGDLHYQRQHYDRAFDLQQKRQEVERLYGLRAFIGAGRLKGEVADRFGGNLVPEIEQSGRGDDVRELLERIGGTTHRVIVIQGPSGVGKSSLVNAGLIPALGQTMMGAQGCFPVVVRRYKDWVGELETPSRGQTFTETANPPLTPPRRGTEVIVSVLEEKTQHNLRPVLIFDQFEEFFFAHPSLGAQRQFFEFLGQILANPRLLSTKIVLSLRRDYLHLLLVCNTIDGMENISQDILSRQVLYSIDNLTPERTQRVINTLTTNAHFPLEPALVERLVTDLNGEDGVRPIELQIVGAQLQDSGIQTLAAYEALGENPKQTLVQNYLQSVVRACGPEQEKLADLVLYFLTDEQGTRPLQTHPEILKAVDIVAREQGWDGEALEAKLSLVLKIFVGSGLVMLLPAQPLDQYQLVHDYLSAFIRSTRESRFQELQRLFEEERRKRQEAEQSLAAVEQQKEAALKVQEEAEQQAAAAQADLQRTKRQTQRWATWGTAAGVVAAVGITGALTWAGMQTQRATKQVEEAQGKVAQAKQEYEAWQTINNPDLRGQASDGGRKKALEYLNTKGIDLSGIQMKNATLNNIFLKDARLRDVDFRNVNLGFANLEFSTIAFAKFEAANLFGTNLSFAHIYKSSFDSVTLYSAILKDTTIQESSLINADLRFANLRKSTWINVNISEADFTQTNLIDADLEAIGQISNLIQFENILYNNNTKFPKDFDRSKIRCCAVTDSSKLVNADLNRQDLSNLNIARIYLQDVDLTDSNFLNTDMSKAKIIDIDIRRSFYNKKTLFPRDFDPQDQGMYLIKPRSNLENSDLVGRDLSGANLGGANLRGANLEGANLSSANLEGANLSSANLNGADLRGANLISVNFRDANLKNARLKDDQLQYTNLTTEQKQSAHFD